MLCLFVSVAHSIFGLPATINCANYVYVRSLQRCCALRNEKAMDVYVQEMLRLHQGQGLDILWRDQCQCPSEDDYIAMVENSESSSDICLFALDVLSLLFFQRPVACFAWRSA